MSIRARGLRDTRLNRIEDRAARDGVVLFSQILNLFLVPAVIAGAGILRSFKRRET
jgi:hypothetical protein